ncbi:MAG: hypothetical protein H7Y61_10835 [Rhizobiales bacterium]|nr:hypothetical protein [Rhizobacter sp.]
MVALTMGTLKGLVAATGGAPTGAAGGAGSGTLSHPTSNPRIAADSKALLHFDKARDRTSGMWVLILEALGAALLLGLIVWWTMFHGRRNGERDPGPDDT